MRTLNFNIEKQTLEKSGDFSHIVSGSSGYLKCQFSFCKEWDGLFKIAEFRKYLDSKVYPVQIYMNFCYVPEEVLDGSRWYIDVVGKKGEKQIKTNKVMVRQEV